MALLVAGCGGGLTRVAPPVGTQPLTKPQLELRVLHAIGPFFYCDPDVYPVGFGTPTERVDVGFAKVERDPEALRAVLADLHEAGAASYPEPVKARVWDRYKRMKALNLQPTHDGYSFAFIPLPHDATEPSRSRVQERVGFISRVRAVSLGRSHSVQFGGCPICLVRDTSIATPRGPMPVQALHVGDPVWTADRHGRRVSGNIVVVGRLAVGPAHQVIVLTLADARHLAASPGHPLDDGRQLADLDVGDAYDGSHVTARAVETYTDGWTYDVLPSGATGTYWADGIRVSSTLRRDARTGTTGGVPTPSYPGPCRH
jgi:hypothetical protein